jgi:Spy/CpxP family protein refolding chaperone
MAKTWQVILATIVIFVAGLVTGGATALGIVRWAGHHRGGGAMFGMGLARSGQMVPFGQQLMRSFANKLDLTEEQRAKIAPIVRRAASELARDRHEVQQRSAQTIERMQDQVREILTPEQRVKFEELVAQQRARLQQFRRAFQAPPEQGAPPAAPAAPK